LRKDGICAWHLLEAGEHTGVKPVPHFFNGQLADVRQCPPVEETEYTGRADMVDYD
jgi:hypothetical protein